MSDAALFELSFAIDETDAPECSKDVDDAQFDGECGEDAHCFELAERYEAATLYGRRERKAKFTKRRIDLARSVSARTARRLELFDADMKRASADVVTTRLRLDRVTEPKADTDPNPNPNPRMTSTHLTTTSSLTRTPPPVQRGNDAKYEQDLRRAINASQSARHESGLTLAQVLDLSNRDLTPEDYELLLLLDTTVPKKTASESDLKKLGEAVLAESDLGGACAVCMCDFEVGETATTLPCMHVFHAPCIGTWLSAHSQACPLCNASVTK